VGRNFADTVDVSQLKVVKKGEILVKEGEKSTQLYLISSGLVSVCIVRDKKNIELYRIGSGQVIGEELLMPSSATSFVVLALNETKVYEITLPMMQQNIEATNSMMKLFIKGVVEKLKVVTSELKSLKLEGNTAPCPADNVAKVFGVIFHTANAMGTKKDGKVTVSWQAFKKYIQRVFLESPVRLEQAMYLLVKLKLAEKEMAKSETDPTAPEELGFFHILDLVTVERFFDFYQNYHFKPGYENILKYDEKCMQTASALLRVCQNETVDRNGTVYLNFKDTLDKMKAELGATFNLDALDRLQQKGLFIKRQTNAQGGAISFLKSDFEIMVQNWKFLKEIDKWNELGFVDLTEPKELKATSKGADGSVICASCKSPIVGNQKFCGECGNKL
jgi:CRP-like cAMP-binding protein